MKTVIGKGTEKDVIVIDDLEKTFRTKAKEGGVLGSVKAIFAPRWRRIHAVNRISFRVSRGELVAFIGPNGAGKSTTLKMLSGILYPDAGHIEVLGLDPTKQRKRLAYSIGTVFGQKPQLWFHLPAIDTFNLFSKIYEIDPKDYQQRVADLILRFNIESIVDQPVRKLSLGQRMRCEFVLSLLHKPQILFLDEPTIGLDITAKKSIRELIRKINDEEKVTVILTSHDMQDIESICSRAIIINNGTILYDGSIDQIRKRYLKSKQIEVLTQNPIQSIPRRGVKVLKKTRFSLQLELDTDKLSVKELMADLLRSNDIQDITIKDPPIEDIIERFY